MEVRKRIIPEIVLRHKKPSARAKLFEKYYARYRRSKWITIAWFCVFGALGAHRIYLKQFVAAIILASIWMLSMAVAAGTRNGELLLLLFIILVAELILLPINIFRANKFIRETLEKDIESVSYIPLS